MKQNSIIEKIYDNKIAKKELEPDPYQKEMIISLGRFEKMMSKKSEFTVLSHWQKIANIFQKNTDTAQYMGVYLYGSVGRGKTMLMDLFYAYMPIKQKKRVHFHEFMREAHKKLHDYRALKIEDPVKKIAIDMTKNIKILFFDEMQILDITDAMLIKRLLEALLQLDVRFVMTSNRPPEGLYKNGLNRPLFLPFIDMLNQHFDILHLDAPIDYRAQTNMVHQHYLFPATDKNKDIFDQIWGEYTQKQKGDPQEISIMGRTLILKETFENIIRFPFSEIFGQNLGVHDFEAIMNKFTVIFIEDIPILTSDMRNEATRFRNFIDVAYEKKVKIYFLSTASMNDLYIKGDFSFEFQRTLSRVKEIISIEYNKNT